jgi:hypothetical protein
MAAPTVVDEKYTIRMRSRYAAALVLLDWYLMVAPPLAGPPDNAPGNAQPAKADVKAPLSRWTIIKIFPSQKACEAERAGNAAQRCLEANDPRFRENNRENEHGPLTPAKSGAPT